MLNIANFLKSVNGTSITAIVAKSVSATAIIMLAGKAFSYAANIIFVRLSNPAAYGLYVYYMAWVGILAILVRLGLDTALLRFVSQYHENGHWSLLKGLIKKSHLLVLQIILLGTILSVMAWWLGLFNLDRVEIKFVFCSLSIVWLLANVALLQSSMRAIGTLVSALLPEMVGRPILMIILVVVFFFFSKDISAFNLLAINAISLAAAFILQSFIFNKMTPIEYKKSTPKYETREWVKAGIPFLLLSGINIIMNRTDIIMIGFFMKAEEIAIYSSCVDLTSIMLFALTATSMVMVPLLARLYVAQKYEEINQIMKTSTRWLALLAVLAFLGLVLLGKELLALYDESFRDGYIPLVILSFGFAVNVAAGMVGALLNMTGREKIVTASVGFCGLLNVILNWILIPIFGLNGAALATSSSMILWNIILFYYVHYKFLPTLSTKCKKVYQ